MAGIWLRWSWRDLRARWIQVGVIAVIVALGVGTYAGLTSTSSWRRTSYDASYRRLAMYDLRAALPAGTFAPRDALDDAGATLRRRGIARAAAVQTEGPIQLDASRRTTVLVPGLLIGVDATGDPGVNRLWITQGRRLRPSDAGRPVVLLDEHFAARRGIRVGSTVRLSGDRRVTVVGRALSPEHFIVLGQQARLLSDADHALVYAANATAGDVLGIAAQANVLVMRRAPTISEARARRELRAAVEAAAPGAAVTITDRAHDPSRRLLYDDIRGDQRLYDIFAVLILLGAAFAAFNLTARIVESQRREIGVGMALGVPTSQLAIRPLLMGLQIALFGSLLGAVVGLAFGSLMVGFFRQFVPLPIWRHPFQLGIFLRAAALGLALPFVATIFPVWRAVRVAPVDAITTGVRRSRNPLIHFGRGGRGRGGHSIGVLPFRNVRRSPRRTVLTALGISAAIAVLLGVIGMIDSFRATADAARAELVSSSPRRLTVSLTSFVPTSASPVAAVRTNPLVGRSATELNIPATVREGGKSIDVLVVIGDLDGPIWRPHVHDRRDQPGIVLTEKAIHDLGVAVGERVEVRYPRRAGLGYRFVTSPLRIVGATPFPLRSVAWMDDADGQERTNLEGVTNVVIAEPRPNVSSGRIERALFEIDGVASVQPITSFTDSIKKELDRALGFLFIVEAVVLLLAMLIAFNTASINADDRAREHATMFAFGLPVRMVVGVEVVESLIVGVIGTAAGLAGGYWLLHWLNTSLLPTTVPDIGIVTAVATSTLILDLLMGVLAVALAPVLTLRKLLGMDIPSTLRVVE